MSVCWVISSLGRIEIVLLWNTSGFALCTYPIKWPISCVSFLEMIMYKYPDWTLFNLLLIYKLVNSRIWGFQALRSPCIPSVFWILQPIRIHVCTNVSMYVLMCICTYIHTVLSANYMDALFNSKHIYVHRYISGVNFNQTCLAHFWISCLCLNNLSLDLDKINVDI